EFNQQDVRHILAVLEKFDAIFALLNDDDAEKLRALGLSTASASLSDAEVQAVVAEREAARKRRDFQTADRLRQQLAERGIILEATRDRRVRCPRTALPL